MNVMDISLLIVAGYLANMGLAAIINLINASRFPKSFLDFLLLTFFPYTLFYFIFDRRRLR